MKIVVGLRNVLINHTLRTERIPNTVKLSTVGAGTARSYAVNGIGTYPIPLWV